MSTHISDQPQHRPFYLASKSPRRRELLAQVGLHPEILVVDVPEVPVPGQTPADYALATALAKSQAVASIAPQPWPVLGADTDVSIEGRILGKPRDAQDAVDMLLGLSGRWHEVTSAVVVIEAQRQASAVVATRVKFAEISRAEALAYWASGEPCDKAGAYAIQGYAARWIEQIEGSYSGVVGLPLQQSCKLLAGFGIV